MLARAREAGVELMLSIGTGNGPPDLEVALRVAGVHDDVYATVGVHPHDAKKFESPATTDALAELCRRPKVLAVGEIGLDYHYDHSPREFQKVVFIDQMQLAKTEKKPIVIHTREAWNDTLTLLEEHWRGSGLGGVLHCFTGSAEHARRGIDLGFQIALGGALTFARSEELRLTASELPLDSLLVETDAPYLTPAPFRKIRPNEPRFVVETAKRLAEIRGVEYERIAEATTRNFRRLFDLPPSA